MVTLYLKCNEIEEIVLWQNIPESVAYKCAYMYNRMFICTIPGHNPNPWASYKKVTTILQALELYLIITYVATYETYELILTKMHELRYSIVNNPYNEYFVLTYR